MVKTVRTLVLTLGLTLCAMSVAFAQGVQVDPKPLDAKDPQATRAAALVKDILAGDRAAALKTLRAESNEKFLNNPNLEKVLDAQIARLGKAKYTISGFQTGLGADVIVMLQAPGAEDTNIVVRFDDTKKIAGFAQMMTGGA
jgi:hypothetical protein